MFCWRVFVPISVLFSFLFASSVSAQSIQGSAHDFSTAAWNTKSQVCVVCHAPHDANTNSGAPLWNHAVSNATYSVYSSSTLDAAVGQPDGNSKLCLSCHDGTVAVDNYGAAAGSTEFVTGSALVTTDLSKSHPVSFIYNSDLANQDGGLFDPATASSGLGGTIDQDLLFNKKLQCGSCHDVHNRPGNNNLLIKDNTSSALCLTCHNM